MRRLGDFEFFTQGSFIAFNSPFNAGSLKGGGFDFDDSTVVQNNSGFPANTAITWQWPASPCPAICGFLQASYGTYDGGIPQAPITSRQVKSITTLTSSHNLTISGVTNGYDIIYDTWLTQAATGNVHLFEIEVFLDTPQYSIDFFNSATPIGTVTISGITWSVAVSPGAAPDILFKPTNNASVPIASIDMKAMLSYLTTQGQITGNEWYNGHAIGVEPRNGTGSAIINSFSVSYN